MNRTSVSLLLFFIGIANAFNNLTTLSFKEAYSPLFGHRNGNIVTSPDGKTVSLILDRFTGAGFISSDLYNHAFYSAKIKLPGGYTAGICVAFYTSNAAVFEKTHDELDFEFLGNVEGKPWRFQTNIYGNGSTHHGREERYHLWFDPTKEFHRYSILWTPTSVIFYIDEVPIREVIRNEEMGLHYPSKPMALYATIWDASNWATNGGKHKVNYKYAPFVAEFKDLVLDGCLVDPIEEALDGYGCDEEEARIRSQDYSIITPKRQVAMRKFRSRYMYYSYCYDKLRYFVPPRECVIDPYEQNRFKENGGVKEAKGLRFGGSHHRQSKRSRHNKISSVFNSQYDT